MLIVAVVLAGVFLLPDQASAQNVFSGVTCSQAGAVPTDWPFGSDGAPINYYVHEDFADKFKDCSPVYGSTDNVTQLKATGVVKHAAELWNVNTLGTPFVYRGHTDADRLQDFCTDSSIQKPAVLVDFRVGCRLETTYKGKSCMEDCDNHGDPTSCHLDCSDLAACKSTASATINSVDECDDVVEIILAGDQFNPHSCGSNARRWHLDDTDSSLTGSSGQSGDRSALKTLVHEFGHALNLGHTSNNAMMIGPHDSRFPNRHPTKWDKDCVLDSDANNYRRLRAHHQSLPHGASSWNSVVAHPYVTLRGHAVDGYWWDYVGKDYIYSLFSPWGTTRWLDYYMPPGTSGNLEFANNATAMYSEPEFDNNFDSTPSFFSIDSYLSSDEQRISYHYHGNNPSSLQHPPRVKYLQSDNLFDSWSGGGGFSICDTTSCTTSPKYYSSVPFTHTYDLASGTDILVTVQDTADHDGGTIHVHPGMNSSYQIRPGFELSSSNTSLPSVSDGFWDYTHMTDFKPAAACAPTRNDFNYNCLLAWAPRGALSGQILYTYFYYDGSTDTIEWHGTAWARAGSRTRNHVSAAYFDDRFWMAWKHWSSPQSVKRTQNNLSGYSSWSSAVKPGGVSQPLVVDPPTFLYVPLTVWAHESGWTWTEYD